MFGLLGLRHFYLGEKKLGWLRLGLVVGGYALMLLGAIVNVIAISLLGLLALLVGYVWAIVDFFIVYFSVKTDGDGRALVATARDKRWAKTIFWVTIGLVIAYVVLVIIAISVAQSQVNNFDTSRFAPSSSGEFRIQNN